MPTLVALLALAAASQAADKPRLTFIGINAASGVTADTARALSDYVQSEVAGTGVYDVISSTDIEQLLGVERQKQLLGCSETSDTCMAEIAGALNSDRLLSGTLQRADDTVIVSLSLIDPKAARVVARAFRKIDAASGMARVNDEVPALVYELVNQEPRLAGRTVSPERGFGGLHLGVLGIVDFLGFGLGGGAASVPIAPGILVEYSGRLFGFAVTVLPKADFGARVEARWYPVTFKNLLRPHLGLGSTALLSGASVRGAAGATLKVGHFSAFLDVAYERFFNFSTPPGPAGRYQYTADAVVAGLGIGWMF